MGTFRLGIIQSEINSNFLKEFFLGLIFVVV